MQVKKEQVENCEPANKELGRNLSASKSPVRRKRCDRMGSISPKKQA